MRQWHFFNIFYKSGLVEWIFYVYRDLDADNLAEEDLDIAGQDYEHTVMTKVSTC